VFPLQSAGSAPPPSSVSWEKTVRQSLGARRNTELLIHKRWTSDARRAPQEDDDVV
jgi:hypothetical protein